MLTEQASGQDCEKVLMIKITDSSDEQKWSLQGRLVDQAVTELRSIWRKVRLQGDKRRCIVELSDVTLISRSGEGVLAEMMTQGAKLIASDVYTKYLLRKLRRELERNPAQTKPAPAPKGKNPLGIDPATNGCEGHG
jgi:hypothetical protein